MKKICAVLLLSFSFLFINAQIKVSDKLVISLPTLQPCDECKDRIEFFISKIDGVTYVKVDVKRKTLTVKWLTDRTDKESLKTAVANIGFDADDIEAEEFAYKRLPACCKKASEKSKAPVSDAPKR